VSRSTTETVASAAARDNAGVRGRGGEKSFRFTYPKLRIHFVSKPNAILFRRYVSGKFRFKTFICGVMLLQIIILRVSMPFCRFWNRKIQRLKFAQ